MNRERVDGTSITIGHRVYRSSGKQKLCRTYSAEYRDHDGNQFHESLKTNNKLQARRLAIELQQRLEKGIKKPKTSIVSVDELTDQYLEITTAKGLSPKTIAKYTTDISKLLGFCMERKIRLARQFSENDLYLYRQYLVNKKYADKTVQGAIILAKQLFKWAWRQGILQQYRLEAATFPKAKAGPQPCFRIEQVDALIQAGQGEEKLAFALMGYAGLRIGEVEQLHREDIIVKNNQFTMIHIRRGGSNGTTKDKDHRFVPIHPSIAELLKSARKSSGILLPTINARKLLKHLKVLCAECEFDNPSQYKLHTFRHHFASMCANHGVAHRKALAWLGHSSSDMLDLYYHLHDEDSQQTMLALAKSHIIVDEKMPIEGSLRTVGQYKIEKTLQVPEVQELVASLSNITERAGFEPAVETSPTQPFQGCSLSHSDTSPADTLLKAGENQMVFIA